MKISTNSLVVILIVTIVGGLLLTYSTDFSIIGQDQVSEKCRFDGEDCKFNLTLPNYRTLDSYTLDMTFSTVPGEIEGITTVSPVSNRGSFRDQWVTSTGLREETYFWFYFYRIPSSWNLDEIYSVYIESEVSGSERRTSTSARFFAFNQIGLLKINHPSNTVQTCGDVRWRDYPMCVIRSYTDRWNGISEIRTSWRNIVWFRNQHDPMYYDSRIENPDRVQKSFKINYEGHILINDFIKEHSLDKNQVLIVNMLEKNEMYPNSVSSSLAPPPVVRMGYTKSVMPSNVQIFVGNELLQTINKVNENMTTNDLATAINEYCRRETTTDDCVVPLTIKSATDGNIRIHTETGVLKAMSFVEDKQDVVVSDPVDDKKTNFRFKDFIRSDIAIYSFVGLILLLIGFIVWFKWFRK